MSTFNSLGEALAQAGVCASFDAEKAKANAAVRKPAWQTRPVGRPRTAHWKATLWAASAHGGHRMARLAAPKKATGGYVPNARRMGPMVRSPRIPAPQSIA